MRNNETQARQKLGRPIIYDKSRIIAMYKTGVARRDIAKEVGCSRSHASLIWATHRRRERYGNGIVNKQSIDPMLEFKRLEKLRALVLSATEQEQLVLKFQDEVKRLRLELETKEKAILSLKYKMSQPQRTTKPKIYIPESLRPVDAATLAKNAAQKRIASAKWKASVYVKKYTDAKSIVYEFLQEELTNVDLLLDSMEPNPTRNDITVKPSF